MPANSPYEAHSAIIAALVKLAESRDGSTGRHLEAVRHLCVRLAEVLRDNPDFAESIDDAFIDSLRESCVLHDIGKVGIPDDILLKPARLNDREFEIVKGHAILGANIVRELSEAHPDSKMLATGVIVARSHHERWDGRGYPDGTAGTDIPLAARIVAVADAYDALRSQRCYQDGITHERAVEHIESRSGSQFDPQVIQAFLACSAEIARMWDYADQTDVFPAVTASYREPAFVKRALRDLEAVRLADRALIRAENEADFAQEVASICVKVAGYKFAWVGYALHDEQKNIQPVAWAGDEQGYLAKIGAQWSDSAKGNGPNGIAIKTGKPVVVRSTDTDELFAPWRTLALDADFRSIASLPLLQPEGAPLGVLGVYSNHEDAFDDTELELLTELADELAFGIQSLRQRDRANRYHALWMRARDAVLFIHPEGGGIIEANEAAEAMYELSREELLTKTILDLRSPATHDELEPQISRAMDKGLLFKTEHVRSDGTVFPVEVSSGPVEVGGEIALYSTIRDITDRVEAKRALRESEAQLRLITDMIADVVVRFDEEGTIVWVSPSLTHALGWNPSDWIGRTLRDFLHPEEVDHRASISDEAVSRGGIVRHRLRTPNAAYRWVEVNAAPFVDSHGNPSGEVATFRVVDEQVAVERELERLARYDDLTGVFNRGAIIQQTDKIVQGHRRSGDEVALMFCDVDNLRDVNEEFGHGGGDELLRTVARRISDSIRADDIVGRIGGDEFLVVLRGIQDIHSAVMVAEKVRVAVSAPMESDGLAMAPSVSIGVTLAGDEDETHAIIDRADRGLLRAKSQGKDKVIVVNGNGNGDGYEFVG